MAEEKNIPGVATEKESDEVLEDPHTGQGRFKGTSGCCQDETRSDPGSGLFFQ